MLLYENLPTCTICHPTSRMRNSHVRHKKSESLFHPPSIFDYLTSIFPEIFWTFSAWVTRPETLKGANDKVKRLKEPPITRSRGPGLPVVDIIHKIYTEDQSDKHCVYNNDNNNEDVVVVLEKNMNMVIVGVVSDGAEYDVGARCLVCTLHWHWQVPLLNYSTLLSAPKF